jgi:ArsR family transcriptional regulator
MNMTEQAKYHGLPSNEEVDSMVELFKAFGDKTRYRIISMLAAHKMTVNEIASQLDVSQPAISHQLTVLRHAGLVIGERKGLFVVYQLADQHIITILQQAREHRLG